MGPKETEWVLCDKCKTVKNETADSNSALSDGLSDAVFHVEGNLLVLRTPEGWMLWNSMYKEGTTLGELIEKASLNFEKYQKEKGR
jgi:hypothetical protein